MGGTPVLIIGRTCDALFKRLIDFFFVLSHFCLVFLFEEWVLEIVCSNFCCQKCWVCSPKVGCETVWRG